MFNKKKKGECKSPTKVKQMVKTKVERGEWMLACMVYPLKGWFAWEMESHLGWTFSFSWQNWIALHVPKSCLHVDEIGFWNLEYVCAYHLLHEVLLIMEWGVATRLWMGGWECDFYVVYLWWITAVFDKEKWKHACNCDGSVKPYVLSISSSHVVVYTTRIIKEKPCLHVGVMVTKLLCN